jgi:tRNA (guanine37-N1)-methyltransferase
MRFDIITIFPDIFAGILDTGIIRRARKSGIAEIRVINLRDFAEDRHHQVDDRPYGGGEGMVFMPEPLFAAVEHCKSQSPEGRSKVVLLSPQGKTWSQALAGEMTLQEHLIFICGRYEGIDQRVVDTLVDTEISIGDFVLSGGELAAMVLVDTMVRLLPGALGNEESARNESFSTGILDFPQYTRPAVFRGLAVPEILLSGDHARIAKWRAEAALQKTLQKRPELARK